MTATLRVVCLFTLLATVFLTVSLLVLQPPRANMGAWIPAAALFLAQGVLTLVTTLRSAPGALRWPVIGGGCLVAVIGGSWVASTAAGPHFEGYALLLGSALVVQGALTVAVFAAPCAARPGKTTHAS